MTRVVALLLFATLAMATTNAHADNKALKHLLQDKFQVAEIFEMADFASNNCPGVHLIEDAVIATAADLGFAVGDDIIYSPEYNFWVKRGQEAAIYYAKDPAGWCDRMWSFLGPDHPPMIRHTLLSKP